MTKEEFYRIYANTPLGERSKRYWGEHIRGWTLDNLYRFIKDNDMLIAAPDQSQFNRDRLKVDTENMLEALMKHNVVVYNGGFRVNRSGCAGCTICDTSMCKEGVCGCHLPIQTNGKTSEI